VRKLLVVFMMVTIVFLSGCSLFRSDSKEMFNCLSEFGKEEGCNRTMSEDIVPLGVIDYIEKGEYDVSLENATVEGKIMQLDNKLDLIIEVEFDELVISASMIDLVVNLVENLYNDALDNDVEPHSVVVVFRQFNYDSISVVKSDDTDDSALFVYYHTNNMNLNTVIKEKEIISLVFSYQESYFIKYRLSYVEDTKDYTIDPQLSLNLYGEKKTDIINYNFFRFNYVDVDFEENDFYQVLFDEFPEKQFSYD